MKNTQLINQLAVSVGKISYLFKSIRKSNAQTKQLEIALLKQYAVDLYDQVLALERENKPHSDTSNASVSYVKSKIAEKVKSIKEEANDLDSSLEIVSFEENDTASKSKVDIEIPEDIPAEMSAGILVENRESKETSAEEPDTPINEIPAEMSAGILVDNVEETIEEVVEKKEEQVEEILAIETVSKEKTVMEMVAEVEKEVEANDIHHDITEEDATTLMNIGSESRHEITDELNILEDEPSIIAETPVIESHEEEEDNSTVVFDKPTGSYTENLPIAEKLQRTLAKLKETEKAASKVFETNSKEEEKQKTTISYFEEDQADYSDDDATTVIHAETDDDGATSIINPNVFIQEDEDTNEAETEEVEEPVQPILTDDNSVRTQILDDIVKSSETTQDHSDLDLEVDEDETVALELNDVLARNSKTEYSGTGRRMDISFNQRFAFINQLFKGNSDAYNKALEDIRHSEGYIQALTYVNLNLVHDYGWDSDDPVVKDFKEVIRKCFLD